MKRTEGLFWALLLVATSVGHARGANATYSAEAITAAVHALYPTAKILSAAEGDLNGDGVPDVAACIGLRDEEQVILVLRGTPAHGLASWRSSQRFPWTQEPIEAEIRKGSLFLSTMFLSLDSITWSTRQYRYRHGEFELIGDEVSSESPVHEDQPGPKTSSHESHNYLTGVGVSTREPGNHVERRRSRLPTEALQTLQHYTP